MSIVKRIFHMVGVEGTSIKGVANTLNREGVKPPVAPWSKSGRWGTTAIRDCIIMDDAYRPHTHEEIARLVSPEVAARLDPSELYGVWWYNRTKAHAKQVSVARENGRDYKRQVRYTVRPQSEWIAVPVPGSGVPREWVDAAREAIKENRKCSNAGRRSWELSGGILRCGTCGYAMVAHTTTASKRSGTYFYYTCRTPYAKGRGSCSGAKHLSAEKLEAGVWEAVRGLLTDPGRLRIGLNAMIEQERAGVRGDPDEELQMWAEKLAELRSKRERYQEMAADDLLTFDELRARLAALDAARKTAERELAALRDREERLRGLERDRDALLASYARRAPDALAALAPEERHQVYKMLKLGVVASPDGSLGLSGVFGDYPEICESDTGRSRPSIRKTRPSTASSSTASGCGSRRWRA
jgi:site-specific DNA recombinase